MDRSGQRMLGRRRTREQRSDTEMIIGQLGRYAIALDAGKPETMRNCFTPCARLDLAGVGIFTINQYIELCRSVLPRLDGTHHQIGLPVITYERKRAWSRTYFTAVHIRAACADCPKFTVGGWYDDEWVSDRRGWRIRFRRGTSVWTEGNSEVLA